MEVRVLEPEEYGTLTLPDKTVVPSWAIAVGAFDSDRLVGRLVGISLPFIECAWIDPDYRNGTVGGRLECAVRAKLKELGASLALAIAVDGQMEDYLARLGYTKFGTVWKKEL